MYKLPQKLGSIYTTTTAFESFLFQLRYFPESFQKCSIFEEEKKIVQLL